MQKKKMVEDVFVKGVLVRVRDALTKPYQKGWDTFVKDVIIISIKKLIFIVILVFLNFYFIINKKIGEMVAMISGPIIIYFL
jgi:hypothetical protein